MNAITADLLWILLRTTACLAVAAGVTATVLRVTRPNWSIAHRLGWILVLLVGWMFLSLPIALPWYDAPLAPTVAATVPARQVMLDELLPEQFVDIAPPVVGVEDTVTETFAPVAAEATPVEPAPPPAWNFPTWTVF